MSDSVVAQNLYYGVNAPYLSAVCDCLSLLFQLGISPKLKRLLCRGVNERSAPLPSPYQPILVALIGRGRTPFMHPLYIALILPTNRRRPR